MAETMEGTSEGRDTTTDKAHDTAGNEKPNRPQRFHPRKRAIKDKDDTSWTGRILSEITAAMGTVSFTLMSFLYTLIWWWLRRVITPETYQDSAYALSHAHAAFLIVLCISIAAVMMGALTLLLAYLMFKRFKEFKGDDIDGAVLVAIVMAGLALFLSVPILVAVLVPMLPIALF